MTFSMICLFTISFLVASVKFTTAIDYKVVYVSVLFRHGDRTPISLYKNDPNPEYLFNPPGLGNLTKEGEKRTYQLGLILHDRYKHFLGRNSNMPYRVKARSTNSRRAKKSMELVLDALYQPGNREPILFSSAPKEEDLLLLPTYSAKYRDELSKVQKSKEVKWKISKFHSLMRKLTHWAGQKIRSIADISSLHHTLTAEFAMGLELPFWVWDASLWEQIKEATVLDYQIHNYNLNLRKYFGGILLKRITKTMNDKVEHKIIRERMQLFSAHETTVVALLSALSVYEPHIPEYSSTVIVELLRDRNKKYYTRILHYEHIPSNPKILSVPGCSMEPCPLDEFMHLMKNLIPSESHLETRTGKFINIA